MIKHQSWLNVTDGTNVKWVRVFHLYRGFMRTTTEVGYFVKASARRIEPPRLEYRGFKIKFNKKGDICRLLLIRTNRRLDAPNGRRLRFFTNAAIIIKKLYLPLSRYLYGPTSCLLRRKRYNNLFRTTI